MSNKITFFTKIIVVFLLIFASTNGTELIIIPLNKPILELSEKIKKISKNIIQPKKKPSLNTLDKVKKLPKTVIKPKNKPKKIIAEKEVKKVVVTKKIEKKVNNIKILLPKNKPIVVKKNIVKNKKKSKYFKQRAFNLAKKSIISIEKRKWSTALSLAKKTKEKSIYTFVQWRHLLTTPNQASFYDYQSFIFNNLEYPRINRIKYIAEHKIDTKKINSKKIIKWFSKHEPLSGYGKLMLGESLIDTGDIKLGIQLIKKGWITADLNRSTMKNLRIRYKKYLTQEDYINRADYLAWENKYWDLKRMLRYLPKDYQLLYTARQILMSKSYGVDKAIKNVPNKFKNDAGLNYDRLKWRRKRGRLDDSLEILLKIKNNKDYLIKPDKWWREREIISRALIYKKRYELAYKVSSRHGIKDGPEYAEAEWMSGWIALSFLNDPILAKDHFANFYDNVGYPISLSRGAYWLGKSFEKIGNQEKALEWYNEASKYLTTYYGQLAFLKVNPNENFELDDEGKIDDDYKKSFYKKDLVKIVYLLDELNKDKYTKHILRYLANDNIEKGSEILAAELSTKISRYDFAIQISKFASYQKRFHNNYNYPIIGTPKYINKRKIPESAIILSIIRQESEFDMSANSHAGAKGLMQIMPYTAKLVSKQAKLPYSKSRLTSDPEYNINLGSHYIAGLILEYDGSYPFAIAAYNAGPNRVKYWKKINGNPQKNKIDYVNWVELIKFKETRNYVQRVLENYNVYRYMLEKKPIKMKNYFIDQPLY